MAKAPQLCHMGHVVMENRDGLVVAPTVTPATGTAEREVAEAMIEEISDGHRITLGADKGYDTLILLPRCGARMCAARHAEHQAPPFSDSRFLVNIVTSHTGISIDIPTNQRNRML